MLPLTNFALQTKNKIAPAYAKLEVTAIYREIVSGETIAARPEMQRLLTEVSNGMWDGVIHKKLFILSIDT